MERSQEARFSGSALALITVPDWWYYLGPGWHICVAGLVVRQTISDYRSSVQIENKLAQVFSRLRLDVKGLWPEVYRQKMGMTKNRQNQKCLLVTRQNDNHSPGPLWPGRLVPSCHQRSEQGWTLTGARSPEATRFLTGLTHLKI